MKYLFFCLSFLAASFTLFSQIKPNKYLTITSGPSFVSSDFYTVNTIADMDFNSQRSWRFDVQYEHELFNNFYIYTSLGLTWHRQVIHVNQHHRNTTIPFNAFRYDQEKHTRLYSSISGGVMLKVFEMKNEKLNIYLPIGMHNIIGLSRTYEVNNSGLKNNLDFESWFWGISSGFLLDCELLRWVSLRLSPTYIHFLSQYPHYTGSQYSFALNFGLVFRL